ncbi:dual specificity protein kinase yak1 [Apophysomyces ossiformis]|uniref:Dual specificity protein kinase yak1 n=1 Tax=Apophysomyces ossiformis TaxID=679940 RepID=A0A8H7ES13_9FUNG|nr:dual specificity protein kinase yak1 [Apophysomyces ossiformis]
MDSLHTSYEKINYKNSTPLSPLRSTAPPHAQTYPLTQDTNYIGITINEQLDDQPKAQHAKHMFKSLPPSEYRHSFSGFPTQTSHVNYAEGQQRSIDNFPHLPIANHDFGSSQQYTRNTTSLSRHASINLPTITTNPTLLQNPQESLSPNAIQTGPHSSMLSLNPPLSPGYPFNSPKQQSAASDLPYLLQSSFPSSPNAYPNPTPAHSSSSTLFSPVRSAFSTSAPPIPEEFPVDFTLSDITTRHPSSGFRKVRSKADLQPKKTLLKCENKPLNPLISLTRELSATYQNCNGGFRYSASRNPRRILTKPSKPCGNDGCDNEDFDYILYVNDILGDTEGHKYIILDVLGAGTFGQVVKCKNLKTQEIYAVKVVKNKMAYFKQSMMEVAILEMLNQRHDPEDKHHILRLKDTFIHRKHLCLVFELMSVNLYELIKQNQFRGLSTNLVRVFTAQILDALTVLNEARIIHCDLKPENILLKNLESPTIKVIDFGSACHEVQTMYTYIQSRFYRSPEVLLGLPYTSAIDMWSLGCIATELFLGLPLFPGSSEYNQLSRIVEMLGTPPSYMIEMGKNAHKYFERYMDENGMKRYRLRSLEQYSREQGKEEQPSKRYFSARTLPDLINSYPIMRRGSMTQKEIGKEQQNRLAFIDFLQGLLNLNHFERWSPQQAKKHPFITGEPFTGPFQPPYIPRKQSQSLKISPVMPNIAAQDASELMSQPPPQPPANGYVSSNPLLTHSAYRNNTESSHSYLDPSYSSLPNFHSRGTKHIPLSHQSSCTSEEQSVLSDHRSSYNGLPLPRVLEPPDTLNVHYGEGNGKPISPIQPPETACMNLPLPNHQQSIGSISGIGGGRPRANTVGTMQVPPQIQWASVDVNAAATDSNDARSLAANRYKGARADRQEYNRFYRYDQEYSMQNQQATFQDYTQEHGPFQSVKVDSVQSTAPLTSGVFHVPSLSNSSTRESTGCPLNGDSNTGLLPHPVSVHETYNEPWDRVLDLERDGDWEDDMAKRTHRRSNSTVRFSDLSLPTSSTARSSMVSNVANLHRRVRGHPLPHNRQDLEWDGVHSSPQSSLAQKACPTVFDEHSQEWKDKKENSGWMIA